MTAGLASATGGWSLGAPLAVGGNAFARSATGALSFTFQGNVTKFIINGGMARPAEGLTTKGRRLYDAVNSSGTTQVTSTGPISAGTSGSHTLTINWVLGAVTILGIDAYDDTSGRIEASIE